MKTLTKTKSNAEIKDFGRYVPGAKKELYDKKKKAFMIENIEECLEAELIEHIKKNKIWPIPNWKKMHIEDSIEAPVLWFISQVRAGLETKPVLKYLSAYSIRERYKIYYDLVSEIRDRAMALRTEQDIADFKEWFLEKSGYVYHKGRLYSLNKKVYDTFKRSLYNKTVFLSYKTCVDETLKAGFAMSEEEIIISRCKQYTTIININELRHNRQRDIYIDKDNGQELAAIASSEGCVFYIYNETGKRRLYASDIKDKTFIVFNKNASTAYFCTNTEDEIWPMLDTFIDNRIKAIKKEEKTKKEKKARTKKIPFMFREQKITRTGIDYLEGKELSEELFLNDFNIGAQFGVSVTDEERKMSLEYCYNSLHDLSDILGVNSNTLCLKNEEHDLGSLVIAYGARGKGGSNAALAHYERGLHIINLTKMKGAGCLAHEWGHALDYYLGMKYGITGAMGTSTGAFSRIRRNLPELATLIRDMKGTKDYPSAYMLGSKKLNSIYKNGKGYWYSTREMFARAFDCYVSDKLAEKGIENTYLSAHANDYKCMDENGNMVYAIPVGKERIKLKEDFDKLFEKIF